MVNGTNMTTSSVSQNLSILWTQHHLVDKSLDMHDQRERRIRLTPDGEKLYKKAIEHESN